MNGNKIMTTLGVLLILGLSYFKGMGFYSQSKSPNIGLSSEGVISQCGEKPNCVSTSNTNEEHQIAPITVSADMKTIIAELESLDLELQSHIENYAHLTYSSTIMGFVDDVEIFKKGNKLYIKSASRVGHSDLGANRERVEKIRKHFNN